ncbi:MAG: hypothetical protein QXD03_03295 [Candidatus Anstonellales archaeon]
MRNFEKELVSIFYKNIECVNFYEFYGDILYTESKTLDKSNYIKNIGNNDVPIMKHIIKNGNITMVTLYGASTGLKYIVNKDNIDNEIDTILGNYERDFNNVISYIGDNPIRYYLYGNFCNSVILNINSNRSNINNLVTPIHMFNLFKDFMEVTGINDDVYIDDGYHYIIVNAMNILMNKKLSFINIKPIDNNINNMFVKMSINVNNNIRKHNAMFPKKIYVSVFKNDVFSTRSLLIYGKRLVGDDFINMLTFEIEKYKLI